MLTFLHRKNRRRRRGGRQATIAAIEGLESRELLAATLLQSVPDTTLQDDAVSIALTEHFDDPDIQGSTVEVATPLGSILIETYDDVTPLTAANFLALVGGGNYTDMFFHRSAPGFVIQGGGFKWTEDPSSITEVENNGNVVNEFNNWFDPELGGLSQGTPVNVRGTIAMAKVANDPDSADSQWFVNLGDNSSNLDQQNGGFTVFARVLPQTLDVVDAIAALPRINGGGAFASLPVRDFDSGNQVQRANVVTSTSAIVDELSYEITSHTNPSILTAEIVDGALNLTPQEGASGTTTITITATDLHGDQVSTSFDVAVRSPLTPVITGPASGTNLQPTISWGSVEGAQTYQLWVNHVGVQNAIIHESGLAVSEYTPETNLAPGEYIAWVRAANAFGLSDWSAAFSFEIESSIPAAVTITSPTAGVTSDLRPSIEWTESEGAESYDLWVNQVGVQNQIIRQPELTTTSFTPDSDLPDGTYRLWVQAKNTHGNSQWSAPVTFELQGGILRLVAPSGTENPVRPRFIWNGAAAESTIELWVNMIGGPNRVLHETNISAGDFIPDSDLAVGDYRAWIREHTNGQAGSWSKAMTFSVGADTKPGIVELESITGTDTARPTITWKSTDNAVSYELWVNLVGGAARVIYLDDLSVTQHTAASDLAAGVYRGWLRAFNSNGDAGDWSSAFTFTIS